MENENRLFRWFAELYRAGYEGHVRFMCAFYGGEPAAKAEEIEELEHTYRNSPDTTERTP
ncbi:hypothetical protein [Actinophytocola sp.]|uniref:hypothetical protein n=1 Tax=Actinophytocola sp. TaxID=1872138 RepID=UPI002ED39BB2